MLFLLLLNSIVCNNIENQYIVVLKDDQLSISSYEDHIVKIETFIDKINKEENLGNFNEDLIIKSKIESKYDKGFLNGYHGIFNENILDFIKSQPEVSFIEKNEFIELADYRNKNKIIQENSPWGLSRISNRNNTSNNKFIHDPNGGEGVAVYVVDTGINIFHKEFEGRARFGIATCRKGFDTDNSGHGTHVAGIIGGKTYGVAKKARIISVQVYCKDVQGSMSDFLLAIQWAIKDYKQNKNKYKAAIMNISLAGSYFRASNMAIASAFQAGILPVVAAGNDNRDACTYSPASAESAITVGAIDMYDKKSTYSNNGKCINIFAPGDAILSSYIGSDYANEIQYGTSMASPHVAGAAAYIASHMNNKPTPKQIWDYLMENSSIDKIKELNYVTPNRLIFI